MSVVITLDPDAAEPPFEQIRAAFAHRIESGGLAPGARRPAARRPAHDLSGAPDPVARARRALAEAGLLETRGRAGSFVPGAGVDREARAAAAAYVDRVRALGLDPAEAVRLVRRALEQ